MHVRRATGGDLESLEWVVHRLSPLLLAQASYRLSPALRKHYDPEDLVEEVWAVAIPRLGDVIPREGRYTPVLMRFLSTCMLNILRGMARKHVRGPPHGRVQELDRHSLDQAADLPHDSVQAVRRLIRKEARSRVMEAILSMPPRDREILILRGIEQVPASEAATLLGMTPNALTVRYRRALTKLRDKLPRSVFSELDSG